MNRFLSVGIIGPGLVGAELVKQIGAMTAVVPFRRSGQLDLKITAISNSTRMLLAKSVDGLSAEVASLDGQQPFREFLAKNGQVADLEKMIGHVIAPFEGADAVPVLVDCTTSSDIAGKYPAWLRRGINVVAPNKVAFSSSTALFREIEQVQRSTRVYCFHEATVGAGLPVIDTLHNLIDTGDQVEKIEGILSGTMSYIFSSFSATQSCKKLAFSEIVRQAKANGFTEPDPRDDLNGVDVARKAVILARICGMNVDLAGLSVENIVPEALRSLPADEFMNQLATFDNYFEELNSKASSNGKVLRYVLSIEPQQKRAQVAVKEFDQSHPFANLSPGDNIISFKTRRYQSPLVVQGCGAGAAVTAGGVFGDVLKVARLFS